MYENSFDYRGYTITKTISKIGATVYACTIDGSVSRSTDAARIAAIIDQKLAQEFLKKLPR